ncbi:hypothetical protein [Cetobacterium sp.]|uniref:hypothetical protein n=1 Tax=Cetobacterium sp. TaxID=2071632 RepID=UPI003F366795
MIGDSKIFRNLVKKHTAKEESYIKLIEFITLYEDIIEKRIPLSKIDNTNIIESMNTSLDMIKYADKILSWTKQLSINVITYKNSVSKRYELEKIKVTKLIETSDTLLATSTKSEKENLKKFLIREELLELEDELESAKFEEKISLSFIGDAENLREFVYAYYQSIKKIYNQF